MTFASRSPFSLEHRTRIDGVDVLRGLAILFVLLNHVNMRLLLAHVPYLRGVPPQVASSLVWNGQRGVQMFFDISGFLITSTSLRRWGSLRAIGMSDFYLLRFARIAPLLLALLVVLSVLHGLHVPNFVVPAKTGGLGRALLAALTFRINVLEASSGYLPGSWDILWSLSVEETFYLFFPLVCRTLGRGKLLIVWLCLFVAVGPFARTVLAGGNEVWQEYSFLGSMDAIAMGCLTALLLGRLRQSPRLCVSVGTVLLLFTLGFSLTATHLGLARTGLDMSAVALGTCFVIAAATKSGWQAPAVCAPLLALGRRSYEVYLTHMFLVFLFFDAFVKAGKPMRGVPVLFVVTIFCAGLLGDLVARVYSEPLNRLIRRKAIPTSTGTLQPS